jgi:hypothetical protein
MVMAIAARHRERIDDAEHSEADFMRGVRF